MNYYEELGVGEQATELEIRKAHRRLVKLMHPDAQRDQSLKLLAESQMRRLNSIVATLLDPAQRQEYDQQLATANLPVQAETPGGLFSSIPWWLASAVGAVVLTLVAIWLWADHLGNSFGAKSNSVYIPPVDSRPATSSLPNPDANAEGRTQRQAQSPATVSDSARTGGISATVISDPPPAPIVPAKQVPPSRVQAKPPPVKTNPKQLGDAKSLSAAKALDSPVEAKKKLPIVAVSQPPRFPAIGPKASADSGSLSHGTPAPAHKIFTLPAGTLVAQAKPLNGKSSPLPLPPGVTSQVPGQAGGQAFAHDYGSSLPASSLPAAAPLPKAPDVVTSASVIKDPLEGEWVYAPKEPERRRAGFYPPEFIDLKLFGSNDVGSLKGRYSAKYLVADKPVSPEVSFELAAVNKGSRRFVWQSANGARGTLNIDPVDDRTIRIDWHTTSSVRGPALTSGQATLIRRQ